MNIEVKTNDWVLPNRVGYNKKIYNTLKKTLDFLDTKSIEYICSEKEITIKSGGSIKILKEKLEQQ